MFATGICPQCGIEKSSSASLAHCPGCLIKLALPVAPEEGPLERTRVGKLRFFGDYELIEQIGRGGMGVVYKAREVALNRMVALKMILAGELASPTLIERFQIEAEAAANLHHPNIVPIYAIGEHGGHHYFSMELVEGQSLDKLMREFTLPKGNNGSLGRAVLREAHAEIARLVATVARAMEYAHGRGILHRDLKPSNILIGPGRTPFLTDFGLAKIANRGDSPTEPGSIVGTLKYMAPERAKGQKGTAASDIYSLGAILYELLTGQPPFDAETPVETLWQLTKLEPERPRRINPLVDPDLATICLKCLEKDAQCRYASADDLAADLERWERFEPIRARRANGFVRIQQWTRRNRMGAALIATLCVGLATVVVLWQLKRMETRRAQFMMNTFRQETISELMALGEPPLPYVEITSDAVRALVTDRPSSRAVSKIYTVAVFVDRNPFATVYEYGPLLRSVEEAISKSAGTAIALNLRIYREQEAGANDLAAGKVHFVRMNAFWYVRAHAQTNAVRALVRPSSDFDAVIFTRRGSGVTNLSQLRGRSLAFGEQASTTSLLAKAKLASAGIRGEDLGVCKFAHELEADPRAPMDREYVEGGYIYSRSAAIYAVLKGPFDAGVALHNRFYLRHSRTLVVLKTFRDVGALWVAGPQVDKATADAFQRALMQLTDARILEDLPASPERYVEAHDEDYNEFRLRIPEAESFDKRAERSQETVAETKGSR